MTKKIRSVIELAKFKSGTELYFIDMISNINKSKLSSNVSWMAKCHPKIFLVSGLYKYNTHSKYVFPKLPSQRFGLLSAMLSGRFVVFTMRVTLIERCKNTGEFYYFDGIDEWHPESILLPTKNRARRELKRILGLISDWVETIDHL
jgi:hypothetical protein